METQIPSSLPKNRGFSLVEIMIVVVIIGILATLAYPQLQRFLVGSRQTEAKTNLMAIYSAQKIYHASNLTYAKSLNDLGVEVGEDPLYTYSITNADKNTFTATATGDIDSDATQDVWTIDQHKKLDNTTNDITE